MGGAGGRSWWAHQKASGSDTPRGLDVGVAALNKDDTMKILS